MFSCLGGLWSLADLLISTADTIPPRLVIYFGRNKSLKYKFSWQPITIALFQENELNGTKEVIGSGPDCSDCGWGKLSPQALEPVCISISLLKSHQRGGVTSRLH